MLLRFILFFGLSLFGTFLTICNAQQPRLVIPAGHPTGGIVAAFSPDGKYIVTTAFVDRTAKLWDVRSGKLLADLQGHTDRVSSATFSPDGKYIVTTSADSLIKIWNVYSGNLTTTLKRDSRDDTISYYNKLTGNILFGEKNPIEDTSKSFLSPNKRFIVKVSDAGKVLVYDAINKKLITALKVHADPFISASSFSPDGKYLATTASDDNYVIVWDANNWKQISVLKGYTSSVYSATFSPDSKFIAIDSGDTLTRIWNLQTGNLATTVKGQIRGILTTSFSTDRKYIVTESWNGINATAMVWNTENGNLVTEFTGLPGSISSPSFSPDGKNIISLNYDQENFIEIRNALTGKKIRSLGQYYSSAFDYVNFSPNGKYILLDGRFGGQVWDTYKRQVTGPGRQETYILDLKEHFNFSFSPDGKILLSVNASPEQFHEGSIGRGMEVDIWDLYSGNKIRNLDYFPDYIYSTTMSPNGKYILTASSDSTAKIFYTATGKLFKTLLGHRSEVTEAFFTPDGKRIVTASMDSTVRVWDFASGKLLKTIKNNDGSMAIFDPEYKHFASLEKTTQRFANLDNYKVGYYNVETGKIMCTLIALDSNDYFVQIPSGYYQCSPNASKLIHYVTKDLKIITFEQLDVKYNRPDLVLEAIGNPDTALIKTYRNAYYKRIKKLGIDTTAFREGYSVPEADFVNREEISFEQKDEILSLHLKGLDSTYNLDRYNVWVNEVPIFGQRGISIRNTNINSLDKTIKISLSEGENRIETSITNINGTESYRKPLTVNYTPATKQKEKMYFIGIGIDQFKDKSYNLNYSVKDIRDLSAKLKKQYGNDIIIDTLFNDNVTVSNIKALKQKLTNTTVNDRVLISYSGHGLLSKDYDYFLSTYTVNFKNPAENGLPYDELESLLDSIPARKKLMLIDACHSGEVDKEEFRQVKISQSTLAANHVVSKGGEIAESEEGTQKLGLKNSFELMQNLFVNVGKSTGATIISAAAGTEFALENGNLKNGVFTYCIMEAMDKYPAMKVSKLKKTVGARVQELTNGMQKPTSRNEAIAVDWNVW